MGNPISEKMRIGAIGELLVQLRLLQLDVQAAPPIKDTGNDLIAIRGEVFRSIQVKTTTKGKFANPDLPERYHIVALVALTGEEDNLFLDRSEVFLVPRAEIEKNKGLPRDLTRFALSRKLINELFPPN